MSRHKGRRPKRLSELEFQALSFLQTALEVRSGSRIILGDLGIETYGSRDPRCRTISFNGLLTHVNDPSTAHSLSAGIELVKKHEALWWSPHGGWVTTVADEGEESYGLEAKPITDSKGGEHLLVIVTDTTSGIKNPGQYGGIGYHPAIRRVAPLRRAA